MFRKRLLALLRDRPMSVAQVAREVRVPVKEIAEDLAHLRRSLEHVEDLELVVTPAECRKCGFQFGPEKVTKPSRCPECRGSWLQEPLVMIRTIAGDPPDTGSS